MGRILEFSSKKSVSMDNYYKLFDFYKGKEFSDTLTDNERRDYDRIYSIITSK